MTSNASPSGSNHLRQDHASCSSHKRGLHRSSPPCPTHVTSPPSRPISVHTALPETGSDNGSPHQIQQQNQVLQG
jgi:hypothetical protein